MALLKEERLFEKIDIIIIIKQKIENKKKYLLFKRANTSFFCIKNKKIIDIKTKNRSGINGPEIKLIGIKIYRRYDKYKILLLIELFILKLVEII